MQKVVYQKFLKEDRKGREGGRKGARIYRRTSRKKGKFCQNARQCRADDRAKGKTQVVGCGWGGGGGGLQYTARGSARLLRDYLEKASTGWGSVESHHSKVLGRRRDRVWWKEIDLSPRKTTVSRVTPEVETLWRIVCGRKSGEVKSTLYTHTRTEASYSLTACMPRRSVDCLKKLGTAPQSTRSPRGCGI